MTNKTELEKTIEECTLITDKVGDRIKERKRDNPPSQKISSQDLLLDLQELFKQSEILMPLIVEHQKNLPAQTMGFDFPLRSYLAGVESLLMLLKLEANKMK